MKTLKNTLKYNKFCFSRYELSLQSFQCIAGINGDYSEENVALWGSVASV